MFFGMKQNYRRPAAFAAILIALSISVVAMSCREKDGNISGPGPDPNGSWAIVLDTASTLYVPNDTISVRLFDPQGMLAVGKLLRLAATISQDSVSAVVTTADTLSRPWGSNPPVYYWGTGDTGGQEQPHEIILAYYIDSDTQDTLAQTSKFYHVTQR